MKVNMLDLKRQHDAFDGQIKTAMEQVVDHSKFINGPEVAAFATELEQYLQIRHCIPCANGTDALQIALMALNLPEKAEIIVPDFTYVATAEVICLLGLVPVFVDVDPDTFCLSVEALKAAITPNTKAIIPVHLFGQTAPMEAIMDIAKANNLFVIEDNAQALGTNYIHQDGKKSKAGTLGHISTTSFFPSKNLGCLGDGGAVFTNDPALGASIKRIANHGQNKKYYHEVIGVNSRLDTVQAAILQVKLKRLDQLIALKRDIAGQYDQHIKRLGASYQAPMVADYSEHSYHQYTIICKDQITRDQLQKKFQDASVASMVYYPVPLHQQNAYRHFNTKKHDLYQSISLCQRVISIPIDPLMTKEEVEFVCSLL